MDSRTFDEAGSPTLLFVMGFGNRIEGATESWFIDRLTADGYRVHVTRLATDIADFHQAQGAYREQYSDWRVESVGHSVWQS